MLTSKILHDIHKFNTQYFYGENVGVYLIELESKILLFDIPTYSEETKVLLKSFKKPIIALLSHGSGGIIDGEKWQSELKMKIYLHKDDSSHPWLKIKPNKLFGNSFKIDPEVKIIHTPGHSAGSVCLLHLPSRSLFTGDTLYANNSGNIINFFKEVSSDNFNERFESCRKLLEYDFINILPFHYRPSMGNAREKLISFISKTESEK